jgi:fructoselysine-6-P-deglycase FrlB-like protein
VSATEREIMSQPATWRRAAVLAAELPDPGARLAVIGCGTSLFMAQSFAAVRAGETDAFPASEIPWGRRYDAVLAISRSGTTTEVVRALERFPDVRRYAITGVATSPVAAAVDHTVVLDFADEESVVQTRFATTALALLLAHLGMDVETAARRGEAALVAELPVDPTATSSFVFLGRGWTVGLANEAALKLREAALATTEAYPALEYRHGPIALADSRTLVWSLGDVDDDLLDDVRAVGATVVATGDHPLADLVLIQRLAVALARARNLDPDQPRNLSRSVVLPS